MYSYEDYCHDLTLYKKKYLLLKDYGEFCDEDFINEIEFNRIYKNNKMRKLRYRKWFKFCVKKYKCLYFLTFTFSDNFLPDSPERAIILFKLFLKGLNLSDFDYRFNIDFGDEENRVHFHGVSNKDITESWNYGFKNCKVINLTHESILRVTAYTNKIVNHAFKHGNYKVIYPIKNRFTK